VASLGPQPCLAPPRAQGARPGADGARRGGWLLLPPDLRARPLARPAAEEATRPGSGA